MGYVADGAVLKAQFPLPPELQHQCSLAGRKSFAAAFTATRDRVENGYSALADAKTTPGSRSRKFLGAMVNPIVGKPMRDAEQFYQTFGRLMRGAWLSISAGLYDEEIQAVADVAQRLILAQVNTVDQTWLPAVSRIAAAGGKGLIVEIGTGRGNSIARLATLLPETRIVSFTISPEQHEIATAVAQEMGLRNVEVRLGDIFDPAMSADLVGQADAVGAIEVVLHFPTDRKVSGMTLMARLLKPGAPLCVLDSAIARPLSSFAGRYYANQSIYFGLREQYLELFEQAGLSGTAYVDHTPDMNQTFKESTVVLRRLRAQLRREFGLVMSLLWPEVPGTVYVKTLKNVRYVQVVGVRKT
jgi:cyclopropane fatty-acyl-phospholipid synthase-like methyltransferase